MNKKFVLILLILILCLINHFNKKIKENFTNVPVTDIYSVLKHESCDSNYTTVANVLNNRHKICYKKESNKPGVVDIRELEDCKSENLPQGYINEPIKSKSNYLGCFINSDTNQDKIDMTSNTYSTSGSIEAIFKTKGDCENEANNFYSMGASIPDNVNISDLTSNISTDPRDRKAFCKVLDDIPNLRRTSDDNCNKIVNLDSSGDASDGIKDYLGGFNNGEEYVAVYQKNNQKHSDFYPDDMNTSKNNLSFSLADITDMKTKCIFYSPMTQDSQYTKDSANSWTKINNIDSNTNLSEYILRDYSGNNNHIYPNPNNNLNTNFQGMTDEGLVLNLQNHLDITQVKNLIDFSDSATNDIMITFKVKIDDTNTIPLHGNDYIFGEGEGENRRNRGVPLLSCSNEYLNENSLTSYYEQQKYNWAFLGKLPEHDKFYTKIDIGVNHEDLTSTYYDENYINRFQYFQSVSRVMNSNIFRIGDNEEFLVLNPPENRRIYSSVWGNDNFGTGHAQSMLFSNQAWTCLYRAYMINKNLNDPNSWTRKHGPVTLIVTYEYNIVNKQHYNSYLSGGWHSGRGKNEIHFGGNINQRKFQNIQRIFRNSDNTLREGYSRALVGDGYGAMFFTSNNFSIFNCSIIPSSSYLGNTHANSYADFYFPYVGINDNVNAMVIFKYRNYLQIDLGDEYNISGVIIQRRKDLNQYITRCKIEILSGYIINSGGFDKEETTYEGTFLVSNYRGNNEHMYSTINFGGSSGISYKRGRYVRIYPLDYHSHPSIRAGVIVNKADFLQKKNNVSKANKLLISDTSKFIQGKDCSLDSIGIYTPIGGNTYINNLYDNIEQAKEIFRIDLGKTYKVFSIITKGCDELVLNPNHSQDKIERANNFLIYYKVAYSVNNNNWFYVRYRGQDQIFLAGKQNTPFEAKLRNSVNARYISIVPMIWYSGNNKLPLRFGVVVESDANTTQFNFNHQNIEENLDNYIENRSAFIIPRKISNISDQIIQNSVEDLKNNDLYSNDSHYALCRCIATNTYHKVKNYKYFKNNYGCHGYGHLVNIESPNENIPFVKDNNGPLDYIEKRANLIWNNLISVFNSKNISNSSINSNVLKAVTCPNIDKSLTHVSSEFNSEKISSNFSMEIEEFTQISIIFNKTDNGINVKCIKNNDFSNEINLEDLTQEELFGESDYKLYIGRLLDHSSNIKIKDFRIYRNIGSDNTLLYNFLRKITNNNYQDKTYHIVRELINRENILFRNYANNLNRNIYMNDIDRLFTFKKKEYEVNNNNDGNSGNTNVFNKKICIRKNNKAGYIGLNVNSNTIQGVDYNYEVTPKRSSNPIDPR